MKEEAEAANDRRGTARLAAAAAFTPALRAALLAVCAPPGCVSPAIDSANEESKCISGNCQNGAGTFRFKKNGKPDDIRRYGDDARVYEGEFKNGLPNGTGKAFDWRGNLTYSGTIKDGTPDGSGIQIYYFRGKLDRAYEGALSSGKRNGTGTYIHYASGAMQRAYVGEWKDGQKEGNGKELRGGVLEYEGAFENDVRQGRGKEWKPDGSSTEGTWVDGKKVE